LPVQHRGLVAFWIVALLPVALAAIEPGMLALGWLLAAILSIATWMNVRPGELVAVRRYRAALGVLLGIVALETVAAASTIVVGSNGEKHLGFVFVAGASLVVVITAWRALVKPSPVLAARAGTFAIYLPIAMLFDIVGGTAGNNVRDVRDGVWFELMLGAFAAVGIAGAIACIASLVAFGPRTSLPAARQVD
jgi:hypothetical protein